jgi:RimJ/RimL family protein N-acetyltransferase
MILKGEKVYLKPLSLDYAKTLTKWVNDPEVIKFTIIKPLTLKEEKKWIIKTMKSDKEFIFNIFLKENNELIGNTGYISQDDKDKNFVLGLFMGEKKRWDKGYGTDAFKTLVNYLFKKRKAKKLILDVRVENKPAVRVYEKCGFKIVRKFKKFWERENKNYYCYLMELNAKNKI